MATSYTPRLGLPEMADGEQSGYVTFNEMARHLDGQLNAAVESANTTTPPASPVDGELWYVPTGATGAWAGNEEKVAQWYNAQWYYYTTVGMVIYVKDTGRFFVTNRPDSSGAMALEGASVSVNLTTTPTAFQIADASVIAENAPNPTTIDLTQSRFTINDHGADSPVLISYALNISIPNVEDTYIAEIYKNGAVISYMRSAVYSDKDMPTAVLTTAVLPIQVKNGDVVELRLSTSDSARTIDVYSFGFSLLESL